MAKSTSNPNVEVPKGMAQFPVLKTNIRDSIGQYCNPGDMAVLTKRDAQSYLDRGCIKVKLPDLFDEDEPDESPAADKEPTREAERGETKTPTRSRRSQRATRTSVDAEGGRPAGGTVSSEAPESSGEAAE